MPNQNKGGKIGNFFAYVWDNKGKLAMDGLLFLKSHLYLIFVGVVFGFANIIPGVSGGTAMVVFGLYERIILLITDFRKRIRQELDFFIAIMIGLLISLFAFGSLMDYLLNNHEAVTQMFFVGVIIASIPMIARKVIAGSSRGGQKVTALTEILPQALMFLVMLWMAAQNAAKGADVAATGSYWWIALRMALYGIIACATMIIPGISGSLVMVMIGGYGEMMSALHTFNFGQLIPYAVGAVIGILYCAKLIKFLLKRFEKATYSAILGFVVGSIFPVLPDFSLLTPGAYVAFGVGVAAILLCEMFGAQENPQL